MIREKRDYLAAFLWGTDSFLTGYLRRLVNGALPNRLGVVYNNSEIPVEANVVSVRHNHVDNKLIEIFVQSLPSSHLFAAAVPIVLPLYLLNSITRKAILHMVNRLFGANRTQAVILPQAPQPLPLRLMLLSKAFCTMASNLVKRCQVASCTLTYSIQIPLPTITVHTGHHPAK